MQLDAPARGESGLDHPPRHRRASGHSGVAAAWRTDAYRGRSWSRGSSSSHPANRLPSSFYLTTYLQPWPFWSAVGLSPDGHGRGTPAQPCAFSGFSYVLLQLEGPTQFFQFGRIVEREPCPKSPTRDSAIRAIISH